MRFLVGNRWRNTYFSESIHLVALHTAIFVSKIQLSPHTPTNPPPTACGAGAGSVARSSDEALGQDGAAGRRHPAGATRGGPCRGGPRAGLEGPTTPRSAPPRHRDTWVARRARGRRRDGDASGKQRAAPACNKLTSRLQMAHGGWRAAPWCGPPRSERGAGQSRCSVLETANSWPPMCTSTLQMVKLGVLESMPLLVLRYATLLYVYGSWRGVRT